MKKGTRFIAFALAVFMAMSFNVAFPKNALAASANSKPKQVVLKSVSSYDYNSIKITWNKVKNADKYQVYRATTKNGKYKLVITTKKQTYINKGLITGKRYYYKVRAVNDGIKGKYSTKKSAVPRLKRPAVSVTGKTQSTISLDWKAVNGAKGYVVYRATSKSGTYKKIATTSISFYKNSKLASGKTYYYKVRAYKKVNGKTKYSKYSYIDKATTKKAVPVKLTDPVLKVSQTANHKVALSWDKVANAEGYILYRSIGDDLDFQPVTKTKGTSYTNTLVKTGTTYYYLVEAYNGKVRSFSDNVSITPAHSWNPVYGEVDNGYYKQVYTCKLCNGLDVTGDPEAHAETHRSWTVTEGQKPQKGYYEDQYVRVYSSQCNQCDAVIAYDTVNMPSEEYNALLYAHIDGLQCYSWRTTAAWEIRKTWVPDENGSETKMVPYDKYTCNHCGQEITSDYQTHSCSIDKTATFEWVPKIETVVTGYKCSVCGVTQK